MSKIKQEEGIRLVCGNCGHRVFEPELMISVANVQCCDRCVDDFIFINDPIYGLVVLKNI